MLKPADPAPGPNGDRAIGELVHQLIEDGKAYVHAEIAVLKVIASSKGRALIMPAALFATAFLLVFAALAALSVGVVLALAKFTGPLLAGILGLVIFAAIAGGLAWWGAQRVKRDL